MTGGSRPAARQAGEDLLVLSKWEEFTGWLLDRTRKWPKSARFTLTQRIENHALDITETLVTARYDPRVRKDALRRVNLTLERMRFLFRIASKHQVMPKRSFEAAMRGVDETGRMVHGWVKTLEARRERVKTP
jgi:hypothetical protein